VYHISRLHGLNQVEKSLLFRLGLIITLILVLQSLRGITPLHILESPPFILMYPYRVESSHATLKRYLPNSQGDLLTAWLAIQHAVTSQLKELQSVSSRQRCLTPLDLDQNLFHGCSNHVTHVALRKAISNYKEAKQAKKPLDSGCTQVFTTTTGLPCAHEIHEKKSLNLGLTKDDFHPHWHWDRYTISPLILEPLQIISRISATSSTTHSTRRLPSSFEATEPHKAHKCSQCGGVDHTSRSPKFPVNIQRTAQELALSSSLHPSGSLAPSGSL
jgi:hypothetical protein